VKRETILARTRALALAYLAGSLASGSAQMPVKLSDLPPKAQQAVQAQVGDGKLREITRNVDGCDVTYDVQMTRGRNERSFTVNDGGELLETEVSMREIPRPVARAIRERLGRGAPESIMKNSGDDEVSYDVGFTKDGKERYFTLDEKGELLDEQMFLEELPATVQSAIQKQGSKPADIYRIKDEGKVYYEVEFERNGKSRTVGFNEKGAVAYQDEPVSFSELPEPARNAAKPSLGEATPCNVNKHTEGDEVNYEIEFKKDGKTESITVEADGKAN